MKTLWVFAACLGLSLALPPVVPINCIASCSCKDLVPNLLEIVSCHAPLTVNSTLFEHLDRRIITVIGFSNAIIEQITDDAFKQFPLLEDIVIENTHIGFIDAKAFDSVKKVKFTNCAFEDEPKLRSEKLEELHFGNCKLVDIPPLDELFSLTYLNLSGNYINNIDIMTFAELFSLDTLILSNNGITRIPANIFINNEDLNSLYLDNNPLKFFYLNTTNKLETLSLKNCYLTEFDSRSTSKLSSLNELNLANNKIRTLKSRDMIHMEKLSVLDLSNNSLVELDNDTFIGNPKLQKLTLDGNKFNRLPNFTLVDNENFQIYTFSCKDCGLTSIDRNVFQSMPAIISLNLGHNKLSDIAGSFNYIASLRILDISYNNLTQLPTTSFANNSNLETLNVAGNPLLSLNPDVFQNTKALKKIDATNCRLYKLWNSNSTSLYSLKKLLIADNQLIALTIADFKLIPHLETIDLHNNPLKVDDDFCKVVQYLEKHRVYSLEKISPRVDPEEILASDIDSFKLNPWWDIQNNKCPEISNELFGELESEEGEWEDVQDPLVLSKDDELDSEQDYDESEDSSEDDDDESETEDEDERITAEIVEDENMSLAKASYILSLTSVFVLTALAVLILAVTMTLCILKRNNGFMHKANLPRLKIPLWESQLTQKKHSGSVYRPLSEDLSGPKTPKCSRYDFSATPTVHGTH